MDNFDEAYQGHISEEENYISKYFSNIKLILKKFGLEDMPIHLDEWNIISGSAILPMINAINLAISLKIFWKITSILPA